MNDIKVNGILKDSNGNAIPNAAIMVVDGPGSFNEMAAITNEDGAFSLVNLTQGTYSLRIQATDKAITKNVDIDQGGSLEIVL